MTCQPIDIASRRQQGTPDKSAPVDHAVQPFHRQRWSPYAFSSRPVAAGDLRSLFEAARWAPSSFNEQPWRFVVATRDQSDEHQRIAELILEGNRVWAEGAPVLILTFAKRDFDLDGRENRFALHDLGQAVAHMTSEASSRGIFIHQMGGIRRDAIREDFDVPDGFEPATAIALGYPASPDETPPALQDKYAAERRRNPQSDFVFSGGWESAWDPRNQ